MHKVYVSDRDRIAVFGEAATEGEFWDRRWSRLDLRAELASRLADRTFLPLVRRHLPPGSRILEGGCGHGKLVYALAQHGYRSVGVDFAAQTVAAVRRIAPELEIAVADVRDLPYDSASFDGYVSGGVIEHFWTGYEPVITEMARVVRPGGFLFVTFPAMSPLRALKRRSGRYPAATAAELEPRRDEFYQFLLRPQTVVDDLRRLGFTLVESGYRDGLLGLVDEAPALGRPYASLVAAAAGPRVWLRRGLNLALTPLSGHIARLVLRRSP